MRITGHGRRERERERELLYQTAVEKREWAQSRNACSHVTTDDRNEGSVANDNGRPVLRRLQVPDG